MAPPASSRCPAPSGEADFNPPSSRLDQTRPDGTPLLVTVKPENDASVALAEQGIRSYLVKEGVKKKRAGLFHSDPVSEIPCCGTPDRRQLKAIRIQLLSGCTVQLQQQAQREHARVHLN